MAGERHGVAFFPGVGSITGCTYTNSHGITPGTAVLKFLPQPVYPSGRGNLIITDGYSSIVLPDCKVDEVKGDTGGSGTDLALLIADRRWRWRDTGAISGEYNQLDPLGKLIPWTIRSPRELAVLCLEALGERRYSIDMPPGLTRAVGQGLNAFVGVGINFPPTGTNPCIKWDGEPPANCLQRLCDMFGRRIVYNILTDSIDIVQPGVGGGLPPGSIASTTAGMKIPDFPSAVAVIGDPTKYQARLSLEPVGREWHGGLVPINALSYAPRRPEKLLVHRINIELGTNQLTVTQPAITVYVKISKLNPADGAPLGVSSANYVVGPLDNNGTVGVSVANSLNAGGANRYMSAVHVGSGVITITGRQNVGDLNIEAFIIETDIPNPDAYVDYELVQAFAPSGIDWGYSPSPLFPGVQATSRLTKEQAVELARGSVWRIYRLTGLDVSGSGEINVPGFGRVVRRHQVHLLESRVDQIIPEPADTTYIDKTGRPLILYYYNGYSKDKPSCCFGSVARWIINAIVKPGGNAGNNTPETSQVMVDFATDSVSQTITFNSAVYKHGPGGRIDPPNLVLETGVHVRHPESNSFVTYVATLNLGGSAPIQAAVRPDVQLNVTAVYNQYHQLINVGVLEVDAIVRARYYTLGMALQYRLAASASNVYNGIMPIPCSGTIQQVTLSVGANGAETQASLNTEHHPYVPTYPARRRNENLAPSQADKLNRGANPPRYSINDLKRYT